MHRPSRILAALLVVILVGPLVALPIVIPAGIVKKKVEPPKPPFTSAKEALEYVSKTMPDAGKEKRILELLGKLGDDAFAVREGAFQEMMTIGPVCLNYLSRAENTGDVEVERQLGRIRTRMKAEEVRDKVLAALRYLPTTGPLADADVQLMYRLFQAGEKDEAMAQAVQDFLVDGLPKVAGGFKFAFDLLAAPTPRERVLGILVVRRAFPKEKERLRPLVKDADPVARYHATIGLMTLGEKALVPDFIDLLRDGPTEIAYLVEDTLCRLHEGEGIPASLRAGTPEERSKCRDAWLEWWKKNGEKVSMDRLNSEPAMRGFTLIAEVDGGAQGGRVWEVDRAGTKVWELSGVGGPVDVQPLPNNNVLLAEYYTSQVTERNRKGDIVWKSPPLGGNTTSAQRLINGNTICSTMNEVMEFDRAGNRVGTFPKFNGTVFQVHRDKRGHTFVLSQQAIVELDRENKQVRETKIGNVGGWAGFQVLGGQRFMICYYNGAEGYAEIDDSGKKLKENRNIGFEPTRIQKLPNGNVLVTGGNKNEVFEYGPDNKVVWKVATAGRPFAMKRY